MYVEVVIGPMFSGKTSYLLSAVKRYEAIGKTVLILKPTLDSRYTKESEIVSHDNLKAHCTTVEKLCYAISISISYDVIIIEESQFFPDLTDFVKYIVEIFKKHVIVIGLDGDSNRKAFGQTLDCISIADKVTRLTALCAKCKDGTPGLFSYRKIASENQVHVGGADEYMTLCRNCYINAPQVAS